MTPEEFKAYRKAKNLTQAEIGKELGYSRHAVIQWEAGAHPIPERVAMAAFGVQSKELADDTPISPKTHPHLYIPHPEYPKKQVLRTLAHPKWYASSDSPVKPALDSGFKDVTTVGELRAFTPPAPEQVRDWLITAGGSSPSMLSWISNFLSRRGHYGLVKEPPPKNAEVAAFLDNVDGDGNYRGD